MMRKYEFDHTRSSDSMLGNSFRVTKEVLDNKRDMK